MKCAYRIPDTAGGDHACDRPSVSTWSHESLGSVDLCERHDRRADALDAALRVGWTRSECPQTPQEGPGRPEAAGAA